MANEIRVGASLECNNGNFILPKVGGNTQNVTQNTLGGGVPGMVSIGTSEEDIVTTDISTLGWCFIKNLDPTNFIKYGPKSGGSMIEFGKLKAGEAAVFRLMTGITIRAVADTAACKVQILILND